MNMIPSNEVAITTELLDLTLKPINNHWRGQFLSKYLVKAQNNKLTYWEAYSNAITDLDDKEGPLNESEQRFYTEISAILNRLKF